MKTSYMILSAASIIPLLSSCASYQKTADTDAWKIKPVYNVRNSSETPESFYQLGRYYQGQSRYELAMDAYQKSLAIDGTFAEARNGLGVVYAMQGRQQEALDQFRLAVSQSPNAAHLYNNLGHALYLHGEYAEAVAMLEKAASLDPKNQNTLNNLGLAYAKAGDSNKSLQNFIAAASPAQQEEVKVSALSDQPFMSQPASSEPVHIAVQTTSTQQVPVQTLSLPKDRGVISRASANTVATTESHFETVRVSPDVYELRERVKSASPTNIMAKAQPVVATPQLVKANPQTAIAALQPAVAKAQPAVAAPQPAVVALQSTHTPAEQARFRIEVSNGNGTTGMAKKVATFLQGDGYASARLTNQKPFTVKATQIQYKSGHQKDAEKMRANLPGYTEIAQNDSLRADIKLRVVLGKDVVSHTAYFDGKPQKLRFARLGLDS